MSRHVIGIAVASGELRPLPKLGLNLEEVEFAFGREEIVSDLIKIGALVSTKKYGRSRIYSVTRVQDVFARWEAGEFDERLAELPGGRRKVYPLEVAPPV